MTAPIELLNSPSKPTSPGAGGGRNQKDRRYLDTFFDVHRHAKRFPNGRPWCGPREIAANRDIVPPPEDGFCIPELMQGHYVEQDDGSCDRRATLASSWTAPWTPLPKYFVFNYKRKSIRFDYAKMKIQEEEGVQRYYKAAMKLGTQIGKIVEPGTMPHPQIVATLGEPSRMATIAEAAMAGDPWLLGFIDEPNPTLADILGLHPIRGIAAPYVAPISAVSQPAAVEAIVTAPANVDLLLMLAEMQKSMLAMQQQVADITTKRTHHSAAVKRGMAKAREASEAKASA